MLNCILIILLLINVQYMSFIANYWGLLVAMAHRQHYACKNVGTYHFAFETMNSVYDQCLLVLNASTVVLTVTAILLYEMEESSWQWAKQSPCNPILPTVNLINVAYSCHLLWNRISESTTSRPSLHTSFRFWMIPVP